MMTSQSTHPPHVIQSPGPVQVGSIDLPWLTFSGSPQQSLEKTRKALLQQYHSNGQGHGPESTRPIARLLDLPAAPGLPEAASTQQISPHPAPNTSTERRGRLEVFLYKYPETVGFLAYDHETSKFSIVRDVNEAQGIRFPKHPKEIPFSIRMDFPSTRNYPYLGLLLRIAGVKELDVVAPVLLTSKSYAGSESMSSSYNAGSSRDGSNIPTTTWTFRACSQSSTTPRDRRIARTIGRRERASSAVWEHNKNTNQLSMAWMMDDDTEEALAAVILDGEQASLQVRPVSNWGNADSYPNETQVKLYFIPDESD